MKMPLLFTILKSVVIVWVVSDKVSDKMSDKMSDKRKLGFA